MNFIQGIGQTIENRDDGITRVYKYRTFSYRNLKLLTENKIYASKLENLNDPFELNGLNNIDPNNNVFLLKSPKTSVADERKKLKENEPKFEELKRSAIFSLSRTPYSHLLWGHYSHGSSGFCVV